MPSMVTLRLCGAFSVGHSFGLKISSFAYGGHLGFSFRAGLSPSQGLADLGARIRVTFFSSVPSCGLFYMLLRIRATSEFCFSRFAQWPSTESGALCRYVFWGRAPSASRCGSLLNQSGVFGPSSLSSREFFSMFRRTRFPGMASNETKPCFWAEFSALGAFRDFSPGLDAYKPPPVDARQFFPSFGADDSSYGRAGYWKNVEAVPSIDIRDVSLFRLSEKLLKATYGSDVWDVFYDPKIKSGSTIKIPRALKSLIVVHATGQATEMGVPSFPDVHSLADIGISPVFKASMYNTYDGVDAGVLLHSARPITI